MWTTMSSQVWLNVREKNCIREYSRIHVYRHYCESYGENIHSPFWQGETEMLMTTGMMQPWNDQIIRIDMRMNVATSVGKNVYIITSCRMAMSWGAKVVFMKNVHWKVGCVNSVMICWWVRMNRKMCIYQCEMYVNDRHFGVGKMVNCFIVGETQ